MFDYFRIKRNYFKATNKIVVPELKDAKLKSAKNALYTSTAKQHAGSVLRVAACMVIVFTFIGVIVFQNPGNITVKTNPAKNALSERGTAAKHSFTLVAYAATLPNSSNVSFANTSSTSSTSSDAAIKINQSTRTVLHLGVTTELPFGKIARNFNELPSQMNGAEVYPYNFPTDSIFRFEGQDITSVTLSAKYGTLFDLGTGKENIPLSGYAPGKSVEISSYDYIRWHLNYSQQYKILTNSNFTDFASIPSDIVSIIIKYRDDTIQNQKVTISFDDDGSIISKLINN